MRRIRDPRPSASIIVALLALIAAVAGTAVAGTAGDRSGPNAGASANVQKSLKKVTKQLKQLKRRVGDVEGQLVKTNQTVNGLSATVNGLSATAGLGRPPAFAHVLDSGSSPPSLDAANSSGVSGVSLGSSNHYCFDLGFTPRHIQATADTAGPVREILVHLGGSDGFSLPCGVTKEATVLALNSSGATQRGDFFIAFYD